MSGKGTLLIDTPKGDAKKIRTTSTAIAERGPAIESPTSVPREFVRRGRLSMEHTGENLVQIYKRNTTESPLLRLPAELRIMIWEYALYDGNILIFYQGGKFRGMAIDRKPKKGIRFLNSAFQLPRICRQIYLETGTLIYALNTFVLCDIPTACAIEAEEWLDGLMPAQREAITTLEPSEHFLWSYCKKTSTSTLKAIAPGLKRVLVPKTKAGTIGTINGNFRFTQKEAENWFEKIVKARENLEVVFIDA